MHPIAGQGWNLGVRDVKNMYEVFLQAKNIGLAVNSDFICTTYHNNSYKNAYSLYQVTDKLNSIFLNENKIVKNFRSLGIGLIEKNLYLKKLITNYAMGIN